MHQSNGLLEDSVTCWTLTKRQRHSAKAASVAMTLLLWLTTLALTLSPDLHHLLHRDAQGPSHHCLVTQMQQDSLLAAASAAPTADCPIAQGAPAGLAELHFPDSCDYLLSPSRAPPALVSHTVAG
jgi:hypothetical protein